MQFRFRNTPSSYSIPIASLSVLPIGSERVLQCIDHSARIPGNAVIPVDYLTTTPTGSGDDAQALALPTPYATTMITDEYYYDQLTGLRIPLWYQHSVTKVYFNSKASPRYIDRSIREGFEHIDRTVSGLLPSNGSFVIPYGSVSVYNTGTGETVPWDGMYVDYSAGSLIIRDTYSPAGSMFRIMYTVVPVDITVVPHENEVYRIEIYTINSDTRLYGLALLSSDVTPYRVRYNVAQGVYDVRETEEYTAASPLFTLVPSAYFDQCYADTLTRSTSRYFDIRNDAVYTMSSNPFRSFSIAPRRAVTTRITVEPPRPSGFTEDWVPRIRTGNIVTDDTEFTVSAPAYFSGIRSRKERGKLFDDTTVSVSSSIYAARWPGGIWDGIIIESGSGVRYTPVSIDQVSGKITVAETLSSKSPVWVTYTTKDDTIPVSDICLNPLSSHSYHNNNSKETVFVFVITGFNDTCSVLYATFPQYVQGRPFNYTYDYLDNLFNAADPEVRMATRQRLYNASDELIASDARIEILSVIYTINPLDEDGFLLEDARTFGGGILTEHRSCYDYSYYDGVPVDTAAYLVSKFPREIINDLAARALEWDPETIVADNPESFAYERARSRIKAVMKKYTPLGATQEILFE